MIYFVKAQGSAAKCIALSSGEHKGVVVGGETDVALEVKDINVRQLLK